LREAIGLEFNNILTDQPIRYLTDKDIVVTEYMGQNVPVFIEHYLRLEEVSYQIGRLQEYTDVLRLSDRGRNNICLSDKRLSNIDFGYCFHDTDSIAYWIYDVDKVIDEEFEKGATDARKIILSNLKKHWNRIEVLNKKITRKEIWQHLKKTAYASIDYTPIEAIKEYLNDMDLELDDICINLIF